MDRRYQKRINRYWKQMEGKGLSALSRINLNGWFSYWHTHPDWKSKGNKCPENRQSAIELSYRLLLVAENLCEQRSDTIQCWATICEDTGSNAIYLHTENPNGTPYPYAFDGYEWNIEAENPILSKVVNLSTHEVGKLTWPEEIIYIIRKRSIFQNHTSSN